MTGYLANIVIDNDGYQAGMTVDNSRHKGKNKTGAQDTVTTE